MGKHCVFWQELSSFLNPHTFFQLCQLIRSSPEQSPLQPIWVTFWVSTGRQQLWSDLKEEWLWIRPNLWLPKTLMHWFLGTQSSALVSSSWRGGVVFFNWDTGGPPRSKSCNTPKTYTNNTKSHTQNIVSVPDILSTALINASMKYMFIQQMGEK